MSKRDDFKNAEKKIKVIVYTSEAKEAPANDVFNSYYEMRQHIMNLIDNFNNKSDEEKMVLGKKHKCRVRTIRCINTTKAEWDDIPILLLQISEHKTGIPDMFVERDEKKLINFEDKVGSDYNCALLYPIINRKGDYLSNNWLIFVYDDPGKDDNEVITTVKAVLKTALNLKIQHVKPQNAKEEIERSGIIPNMHVQYITITNENNERIELQGYKVKTKVVKTEYIDFEEIPAEEVNTFISKPKDTKYLRRKINLILKNNKSLRFDHQMDENEQTIKDAIEQVYNKELNIPNKEIPDMYDPKYILDKLKVVVEEYLKNE